jgi:hypothetical protein
MLKICYIILTCEKYIDTRARWQRENCFFNVSPSDYYFLSCKSGENSVYGWNTIDTYESCPLKYIEFFKNMNLHYDWYVFIDDDTFVFPNRMYSALENIDKTQSLYTGIVLRHIKHLEYMSGGSGFILSNKAYNLVKQYVRTNDMIEVQKCRQEMLYSDVSMGQWIQNINRMGKPQIELKSHILKLLHKPHTTTHELHNYLTFHYLKDEKEYEFYKTLIT